MLFAASSLIESVALFNPLIKGLLATAGFASELLSDDTSGPRGVRLLKFVLATACAAF